MTSEKFQYRYKRYLVQAKRKGTDERWTDWTFVEDYEVAVKHAERAVELGYSSRIIDKGEKSND